MIAAPVSVEEHFATKADLRGEIGDLRVELKEEMGGLRAELKEEMGDLRAELKEEMGELRGEMRHMATKADLAMLEARLTRWFVGLLVAMGGLLIAFIINLIFTVLRFLAG